MATRALIILLLTCSAALALTGPGIPVDSLLGTRNVPNSPDSGATGQLVAAIIQWGDTSFAVDAALDDVVVYVANELAIGDSIYDSLGVYYDDTKFVVSTDGTHLIVDRIQNYENYFDITATLFWYDSDSMYFDTVTFRTVGDTKLMIGLRTKSEYGWNPTGSSLITGYRSPGMDLYWTRGGSTPVETASDTAWVDWQATAFTITWSGLSPGDFDTATVYGINDVGDSSAKIIVSRRYVRLGYGAWGGY